MKGKGFSPFGIRLSGDLNVKTVSRWTKERADDDLYETLALNAGVRGKDAVTFSSLLYVATDLNGHIDTTGFDLYDSAQDTWGDKTKPQLYTAYFDVNKFNFFEKVRAGRQYMDDVESNFFAYYFDGLSLKSAPLEKSKNFQFGLFGGVPVHFFDSSREGQQLEGGFVSANPFKGNKVKLAVTSVADKNQFFDDRNNLAQIAVQQYFGPRWQAEASYGMIDSEPHDAKVKSIFNFEEAGLNLNLSLYALLRNQNFLAYDLDYLTYVVGEYSRYTQWDVKASKQFGDKAWVDFGTSVRILWESDDESQFNHEFQRYFVSPGCNISKIVSVSLTGEVWRSGGTPIETYGADIKILPCKEAVVNVGTNFSLYKYDILVEKELQRVRTYYAGVSTKQIPGTSVRLGVEYSLEQDGIENYSRLMIKGSYEF